MSDSREEKIRAMQEKGTITKEQAEELLAALREEPRGNEAADAERAEAGAQARTASREDPGDRGERRRRDRDRDWDWRRDWDRDWRRYARGPWDSTWWSGGNAQNFSRVEQPEGESFEFKDNRVTFSKIRELRLVRSKVNDNSFSASSVHGVDLIDSEMANNSLAGASFHDLRMERAHMKGNSIAGTKLHDFSIRADSAVSRSDVSGSSISNLAVAGSSNLEDCRISGTVLHDVSIGSASTIKGSRISSSKVSDVTFAGSRVTDTEISGSVLDKVDFRGSDLKDSSLTGVRMHKCDLLGAKIEATRLKAVSFDNLRVENSTLKGVELRDDFDHFHRQVQDLQLRDATLEKVIFINCIFRGTTIKSINGSNLRIEGKNLSGMTIDSVEVLEGLAKA